jgi:hypothetical protein
MHVPRSPLCALAVASLLSGCSGFDSFWTAISGVGAKSPGRVIAIPTPQSQQAPAAPGNAQPTLATATAPTAVIIPATTAPATPAVAAAPAPAAPALALLAASGGLAQRRADAQRLRDNIGRHNSELQQLRQALAQDVATYRGLVGTIEARLQMGAKPADPQLQGQWSQAEGALDRVANDVAQLAKLSSAVTAESGLAGSILGLAAAGGGSDADRRLLQADVEASVAGIKQLLAAIAEDDNRQSAYLGNERQELVTLALAIKDGELYGQRAPDASFSAAPGAMSPVQKAALSGTSDRRPLVVIRFDRPNVPYQQALYSAVNRALERRPDARFDLVAVTPTTGTADEAETNAQATKRNAESVLRALKGMGLPPERVSLSATTSSAVQSNEVQLYVR